MKNNNERYLVSLVLSGRASASEIGLSATNFADYDLKRIWAIAEELELSGVVANILTIENKAAQIEPNSAGSLSYGNQLAMHLETIADDYTLFKSDSTTINQAVIEVRASGVNRKITRIAEKLASDPDRVLDAVQALLDVTSDTQKAKSSNLHTGEAKALALITENSKLEGSVLGAKTDIAVIDDELGGFQRTDFIIVGARSGAGKTAFSLTCMKAATKDGAYAGIISTEMPDVQLGMRNLAGNSGVAMKEIKSGKMSEDSWAKVAHGMSSMNNDHKKRILINDHLSDWDAIKSQIRTWAGAFDMGGGVWIDYLQNIKVNRGKYSMDKTQEASIISSEAKSLAKELNIPIIGLSQLQRSIDNQANKRPTKANLSWAAQFENDSDVILLLYRHEVYDPENEQAKGVTELIIDKNRNGVVSTQYALFRHERMDFVDIDDSFVVGYKNSLNDNGGGKRDF